MDWIGFRDWIGLDWIGLDLIGSVWFGLDWKGLVGVKWGLDWNGSDELFFEIVRSVLFVFDKVN